MPDYREILRSDNQIGLPICAYLLDQCEKNEALRNDIESKNSRSVTGMIAYVRKKAKHLAVNGMAAVEDQTVYNWALDYWHDADLDETVDAVHDEKNVAKQADKVAIKTKGINKKKQKDEENIERISIFDLL
jgi:hypothetical protein